MNIDQLTIREAKELSQMFFTQKTADSSAWEVGKNYLIRTVTMIDTGRLVAVTEHELVLEDAAWIADTGRFADAVAGRIEFNEVEPFPQGRVVVGRGAVIDAVQINTLPREQR